MQFNLLFEDLKTKYGTAETKPVIVYLEPGSYLSSTIVIPDNLSSQLIDLTIKSFNKNTCSITFSADMFQTHQDSDIMPITITLQNISCTIGSSFGKICYDDLGTNMIFDNCKISKSSGSTNICDQSTYIFKNNSELVFNSTQISGGTISASGAQISFYDSKFSATNLQSSVQIYFSDNIEFINSKFMFSKAVSVRNTNSVLAPIYAVNRTIKNCEFYVSNFNYNAPIVADDIITFFVVANGNKSMIVNNMIELEVSSSYSTDIHLVDESKTVDSVVDLNTMKIYTN